MKITPLRAIRKKCLDCSGHSQAEVRQWTVDEWLKCRKCLAVGLCLQKMVKK